MYRQASLSWQYPVSLKKREQRRRPLMACTAALMLLCIGFLAVRIPDRLSAGLSAAGKYLFPQKASVIEEEEPPVCLSAIETAAVKAAPKEVRVPEAAPVERLVPLIYVDAGHGGTDEGCARNGVLEKDINLAIALLVRDRLEGMGYEVMLSREDDTYVAKEDRVKAANEAQADIYISIHQNATEGDVSVNGMEVWYAGDDADRDNKRLAELINKQVIKSTGALERELRGDADFHVTGSTTMPACLIETGFLSNEAELGRLSSEEYQQRIAEGIVQGVEYYFHPKTMYLTFDDGPSKENTEVILDILKERNIKATFFLVGENVRRYPEIAKRIVQEGHTIGIHCDCHDYETLYASVDSYVEDFEKARRTVYEVTGVRTNLFRFPGGSVNAYNKEAGDAIIEEMTKRGYIYYDWNASVEDAVREPDPQQLVKNGVETTLGRKKVIMLAHDRVYSTGLCLPELLDKLPEYVMMPLSEEVEPIQF